VLFTYICLYFGTETKLLSEVVRLRFMNMPVQLRTLPADHSSASFPHFAFTVATKVSVELSQSHKTCNAIVFRRRDTSH
jgi:hypothetical protein